MTISTVRNGTAYVDVLGSIASRALAAGTGDATLVNGSSIDRYQTAGGMLNSAKLVVGGIATIADTKELQLAVGYQTSDANVTFDTAVYVLGSASTYETVLLASGALTNKPFTYTKDIDLTSLKRYVRIIYKPDLTASGTDTATLDANMVLDGATNNIICTQTGTVVTGTVV